MEILNEYLPKDLINIVEEYDKTMFNNVVYQYQSILNDTWIKILPYMATELFYKYPDNYNYAFSRECIVFDLVFGSKISKSMISGLLIKIKCENKKLNKLKEILNE